MKGLGDLLRNGTPHPEGAAKSLKIGVDRFFHG